jgi:hypothetical protein
MYLTLNKQVIKVTADLHFTAEYFNTFGALLFQSSYFIYNLFFKKQAQPEKYEISQSPLICKIGRAKV